MQQITEKPQSLSSQDHSTRNVSSLVQYGSDSDSDASNSEAKGRVVATAIRGGNLGGQGEGLDVDKSAYRLGDDDDNVIPPGAVGRREPGRTHDPTAEGRWAVHVHLALPEKYTHDGSALAESADTVLASLCELSGVQVRPLPPAYCAPEGSANAQDSGDRVASPDQEDDAVASTEPVGRSDDSFAAQKNWEPHVSLSRAGCLRVRRFQIAALVRALRCELTKSAAEFRGGRDGALTVQLGGISQLANAQGRRVFTCLDVVAGQRALAALCAAVERAAHAVHAVVPGEAALHAQPRFHVSIGWAPNPKVNAASAEALAKLNERHANKLRTHILHLEHVVVMTGNQRHVIELHKA